MIRLFKVNYSGALLSIAYTRMYGCMSHGILFISSFPLPCEVVNISGILGMRMVPSTVR